MKKIKRVVAVLLIPAMLLANFLPFVNIDKAFAETIINLATATVVAPAGGEYPSAEVSINGGEGYSATFWEWSEGVTPLSPSDQFETGHDYDVRVIFTADEGYSFDENTTFLINGQTTSSWGGEGHRQTTFTNIPAGTPPAQQPTIVHTILVDQGATYSAIYSVCDPLEAGSIGQTMTTSGMWTVCAGDNMTLSATVIGGYTFSGWYLTHEVIEQGQSTWPDDQLLSTSPYYTFDPSDLGTAYPYIKLKVVEDPDYRQADQIQIWASAGGTVSATYTPSSPNVYDIPSKDGTSFVPNGEVVQFYVGDSVTATAQADENYEFVGWRHANAENIGDDKCKGEVFSTSTTYTWQPAVTVLAGDEEPLRYVCAQFEAVSTPVTTYETTLNKRNTDTEELPYGSDLAAYIESKKSNVHPTDDALNAAWLELFVNTGGVYKYPVYIQTVFTDVTYPDDPGCTGISCNGPAVFHYRYDYTEVTVTASTTVTATFDDGVNTPTEQTVTGGETTTPPADPVRNGYSFAGWSKDYVVIDENTGEVASGESLFDFANTPLTGNTTFFANWKKIHTVTFVDDDGVLPTDYLPVAQSVIAGDAITTPVDADGDPIPDYYNDYEFVNLFVNNIQYNNDPITADTVLHLRWYDAYEDYDNINEVNLTLTIPHVGIEVTVTGNDRDTQEPGPEVTVESGADYKLYDHAGEHATYWFTNNEFYGTPFAGTMVKNGTYYAQITLETLDSDTVFARNVVVKVNGVTVSAENLSVDLDILDLIVPVTPETTTYHITEGDGSSFNVVTDTEDVVIECDGPLDKLTGITLGNTTITENEGEITEGSTILTLKADYLASLAAGNYTVTFSYTDGDATATITIVDPNAAAPDTGIFTAEPSSATTSFEVVAVTIIISALGLTVITNKRRN